MTTPGRALTIAGCLSLYLGSLPSDAFVTPSMPPTGLALSSGRVPPSLVPRRTSATPAPLAPPPVGIQNAHLNSQEPSSPLLRVRNHAHKSTPTTRSAAAAAATARGRGAGRREQIVTPLRSSSSANSDDTDDISGDKGVNADGARAASFEKGSWTSEDPVAAAAPDSSSSSSSSSPAAASFRTGSGGGGSDGAEPPAGGGGVEGGGEVKGGGDGTGVEEIGNPETRAALKRKIFQKVATLNRGFVAQESDRLDVEELIEMLELENPNPEPCAAFETASSPIAGRWQLLYTTSLDVLSLQVNPAVTVGQIFQQIEADGRGIQNIIELQPPFAAVANRVLGSSVATLTVKLETTPVSDSRIDLKFVRTEIKADSFFGKKLDLPSLGVDLPSGDKLKEALSRGKTKVQDAKKKAQGLAKGKQGGTSDESSSGSSSGSSSSSSGSSGSEHDGGRIPEGTEATDSDADAGSGGGGGGSSSSPSAASSSDLSTPYFETTYVDGDMRIGRTGQGDVFISTRA